MYHQQDAVYHRTLSVKRQDIVFTAFDVITFHREIILLFITDLYDIFRYVRYTVHGSEIVIPLGTLTLLARLRKFGDNTWILDPQLNCEFATK